MVIKKQDFDEDEVLIFEEATSGILDKATPNGRLTHLKLGL